MLQFGIGFMGQQFENSICGTEPYITSSPKPTERGKAGDSMAKKQILRSQLIWFSWSWPTTEEHCRPLEKHLAWLSLLLCLFPSLGQPEQKDVCGASCCCKERTAQLFSEVGKQEVLHRRRILQLVGPKLQDLMLMKVHALVEGVSQGFYTCD